MARVRVRLQNPHLVLSPLTEKEIEEQKQGYSQLYLLYTNEEGEIEIGIPDLQSYFPATANMYGAERSKEKAYFYNGGSDLEANALNIKDRPVYKIQPTDDRQVEEFEILNEVEVELLEVLDGSYVIGQSSGKSK